MRMPSARWHRQAWLERETGGQTGRRRCRDAVPSICQYLVALEIFGVLRGKRVCIASTSRVRVFSTSRRPRESRVLLPCTYRGSFCRSRSLASSPALSRGFLLAFTRTNGGRCEPGRASSGVRVSTILRTHGSVHASDDIEGGGRQRQRVVDGIQCTAYLADNIVTAAATRSGGRL